MLSFYSLPQLLQKIYHWIEERVSISVLINYLSQKTVPNHKYTIWYYFGGLTLFFFIIQVLTGILLLFYYRPTPDAAYESVKYLINEVPYGWLVRSIHSWSSNLMVLMIFIHMFSVYLMKAYRKPREMMWLTGVILFFIVLGFGFTGYLLPWDTTAFFATQIGTEIPKSIPIVGEWISKILRGGDELGSETLTRLFGIHVVILPLLAFGIVAIHLILNQLLGTSKPIGLKEEKKPIPFLPNFVLRDSMAWSIAIAVLITLAVLFPWKLGDKANPYTSAPTGIKPEWYFWVLYQTLKIFPSTVFSLNGGLLVNLALGIVALFWLLIPFLNKKASRGEKSPLFTVVGLLAIAYFIIMIIWAYLT